MITEEIRTVMNAEAVVKKLSHQHGFVTIKLARDVLIKTAHSSNLDQRLMRRVAVRYLKDARRASRSVKYTDAMILLMCA